MRKLGLAVELVKVSLLSIFTIAYWIAIASTPILTTLPFQVVGIFLTAACIVVWLFVLGNDSWRKL